MSEKTLTRSDIVEALVEKQGAGRDVVSKILEDLLDQIVKEVSQGNDLKIASFGTFCVCHKKQRIGRNPKTGKEAVITPRRVLSFRASKILKTHVNKA